MCVALMIRRYGHLDWIQYNNFHPLKLLKILSSYISVNSTYIIKTHDYHETNIKFHQTLYTVFILYYLK